MIHGLQITSNTDISDSKDTDFVINTKFAGGMKVNEVKVFNKSEATNQVVLGTTKLGFKYAHNLGYAPAYMAFGTALGIAGSTDRLATSGMTSSQPPFNDSVVADDTFIYVNFNGNFSTSITVFIFGERLG